MASGYIHISDENTIFKDGAYYLKDPVKTPINKPILLDFPNGVKAVNDDGDGDVVTLKPDYSQTALFVGFPVSNISMFDFVGGDTVVDTDNTSYSKYTVTVFTDENIIGVSFYVDT